MPPGKMEEVLLVVNNATFVNNDNELESLLQPFQSMKHGVKFDLIPHEYGGKASMIMDDEEIPFEYDTEKLFLQTRKPTEEDLDTLQSFELTAPHETKTRQKKQVTRPMDIPISEWRKQLGFVTKEVIEKQLKIQHSIT